MINLSRIPKFFAACGHHAVATSRNEYWSPCCPVCTNFNKWSVESGWDNTGLSEQTAAITDAMRAGRPGKPGSWLRADTAARAVLQTDKDALALWLLAGGPRTPTWVRNILEGRKVVKEVSEHAKAAKQCRAEIKAKFPGVHIVSVTSSAYSGGTSLNVTAGGVGPQETELRTALGELVDNYTAGHFDGFDDSYKYKTDKDPSRSRVRYASIQFYDVKD